MSVLKNKRTLSGLEFYSNARKLRKEVTMLLLRDFGIRDKVRNIKSGDGESVTIIEGYPNCFILNLQNRIIRLLDKLLIAITKANTIYPTTKYELERRRWAQTIAISICENLIQQFEYCLDVLPMKVNVLIHFVNRLKYEIMLLKGWRKANEEPRSKFLGIKDFTLKSLPLWGNKSPTHPVTAASCGVLNQMLRNKKFMKAIIANKITNTDKPGTANDPGGDNLNKVDNSDEERVIE
jgi:hypothetical protein